MSLRQSITFIFIAYFIISYHAVARPTDTTVTIVGKVVQEIYMGFSDLLIVNINSGKGIYGKPDGTFEITVNKNDEIKISCVGFKTATITVKDSVYKPVYHIKVYLQLLSFIIDHPVVIRPAPTFREIEQQRSKIGSHVYKPMINNPADAFFHPISALYQLFSRREKEKEAYIALLNQKELEDAQKEILRYLIDSGLFELREDELDRFLSFCSLNEEFVKQASLYEITEAFKACYIRLKGRKQTKF
jgi:hypothetical protein